MRNTYNVVSGLYDDFPAFWATILSIFVVVLALAVVFGMMCFQSWLVMLLWNWVMVSVFDLPVISFWIAFGLRWLGHLLFTSNVNFSSSNKD